MLKYINDNVDECSKLRIFKYFSKLHPHKIGTCKWCGSNKLGPRRKSFCDTKCTEEYCIRINNTYLRRLIFKRDSGICKLCSVDTRKVSAEIYNAEKSGDTIEAIRLRKMYNIPVKLRVKKTKGVFHCDHIQPVFLGGSHITRGVEAVRTLCCKCHKKVTKSQQQDFSEQRKINKKKSRREPLVIIITSNSTTKILDPTHWIYNLF